MRIRRAVPPAIAFASGCSSKAALAAAKESGSSSSNRRMRSGSGHAGPGALGELGLYLASLALDQRESEGPKPPEDAHVLAVSKEGALG
jgi:hypothetical protein